MTTTQMKSCWLAVCAVFCLQSLADVAREEAERRRLLDQQGIEAKVIEGGVAQDGNLTVSIGSARAEHKGTSKKSANPEDRGSVRSFRNAIQKLDRTIRQSEDRLEAWRARLRSERWAIPKSGKITGRSSPDKSQSRLEEEIEELEIKLRQLRQERSEIYESGKKAGFLPGELSGKGIVP
jgi:hypothetical protein